ncbi:hypothetical protein TcWFU_003160 [Taenia crassiceps]|uniref:PEST proteolytic signal-containing nuclear protein n=1 Tax=Taenia crassiceps TaxID=6207 RepID=A0ABR4QPU0_9CEST
MSSGEKNDEDAKKGGFFKKMFGTPGKNSSTEQPKKHTNRTVGFSKTSKHLERDDGQKQHTQDGSPDAGLGGEDPNPDQILRDSSDARK